MKRAYDIVLFGATGYTGRLIFEYLANQPSDVKWAIAGRSVQKLRELSESVAKHRVVDVLEGSSDDTDFVKTARVVISAVGPYAGRGEKLVRACVAHNTHYVDCTGEPLFVKRVSLDNHKEAEAKGVVIVSCCGFDSVPADIGTFFLVDSVRAQLPEAQFSSVTAFVNVKMAPSGGTLASMMGVMSLPLQQLAELRQPYALNFPPTSVGPPIADTLLPGHDVVGWTYPSIMALINTRMVRKTESLLLGAGYGEPYNKSGKFVFDERAFAPSFFSAIAQWLLLVVMVVAVAIRPLRHLIASRVPTGHGPSASTRAKNSFDYEIVGYATAADGKRYRARASYKAGDVYTETAVMVSECALSLVFDQAPKRRGGCLTPAVAFGPALVTRLRKAGHQIAMQSIEQINK